MWSKVLGFGKDPVLKFESDYINAVCYYCCYNPGYELNYFYVFLFVSFYNYCDYYYLWDPVRNIF